MPDTLTARPRIAGEPWRRMLICHEPDACTAPHHITAARQWWRRFLNAGNLYDAAAIMHERRCSVWAERSHGGTYVERAELVCGPGGRRHIVNMMNRPQFHAAYAFRTADRMPLAG